MFPGQGSQYSGMGMEFLDAFSEYREYFKVSGDLVGTNLLGIINGGNQDSSLDDTRFSQISIYTLSCALNDYLINNLSISKECVDTVMGHSLGEYSALYSSGAYSFGKGAELVGYRSMITAKEGKNNKGMMVAVLGEELFKIMNILESYNGRVFIANYNDYRQTVISGYENSVKELIEDFKSNGIKKMVILKVGIASHCPVMKKVSDELGRFINNNIDFNDINLPFFSTTELDYKNKEEIAKTLRGQLVNPVRWVESIEYLLKKGVSIFIEVGPGKVLTGLVGRIARENGKEIILLNTDKMEDIQNLKKILKEEGIINEA